MSKIVLFGFCNIVFTVITVYVAFVSYELFHAIMISGLVFSSFTIIILLNIIEENRDLLLPKAIAYGSFISTLPLLINFISYNQLSLFNHYGNDEYLEFGLLSSLMLAITYFVSAYTKSEKFKSKLFYIGLFISGLIVSLLIHADVFPSAYSNHVAFWIINVRVLIIVAFLASIFILYHRVEKEPKIFKYGFHISVVLLLIGEVAIQFYSHENTVFAIIFEMTRLTSLLTVFFFILVEYISIPLKDRLEYMTSEIEDLRVAYQDSEKSQNVFRTLYENAPLGYQSLDDNGDFLIVNDTFANMLGYKKSEMIGHNFSEFLVDTYSDKFKENFPMFKKLGAIDIFFEMLHKEGHIVTMRFIGKIAYDKKGEFKQTHCLLMDISDEIEYQKGIIKSKSKLEEIISITTPGVIAVDTSCTIISVNQKGLALLGFDDLDELVGHNLNETILKAPKQDCLIMISLNEQANHSEFYVQFNKADGKEIDVVCETTVVVQEGEFLGINIAFRDKITSDNIVNSLVELSYHDSLTGLFNRRYYEEEIKNLDKQENLPLSIIVCDINGLKLVNDAFGHERGDQLLTYAKRVFLRHSSPRDFIARMGGDEFVIVMPNTDLEESYKRIEVMTNSADDFDIDGVRLSISYGTGTKDEEHILLDEIYKAAEDSMYRMKLLDVPSMRTNTIDTILTTLYEKDVYSEEHSRSVSKISELIAKKHGLSYSQINEVRTAAVLHDIGKIATPLSILNKVGKLNNREYDEVKKHSEIGYRILNSSSELRALAPVVLNHHEWWDGSGYPQGIEKENIPLLSRIISVADAYDAIVSQRTYRPSRSPEEALIEIEKCAGTQFDPIIVKTFKKHFEEIVFGGSRKPIY